MDAVRVPRARALPWVACDLPLEPGVGGTVGEGRVTGLSMDAVRLAGAEGLAEGAEVRIGFRLPGQRAATVLSGRVEPDEAGAAAVRIAILGFEKGAERAYRQFVLARVGADTLARQAEALTTPSGRLVPLTDPARIRELLADSLAYRADALVQGADLPQPVRALLTDVTATELLLTAEGGSRGGPLAGTRVRCSLLSRHGPYLFEADVRGCTDGQFRLAFPTRLHQYEKRGAPRLVVGAGRAGGARREPAEPLPPDRIVLTLPPVYGGTIERPLIDVSETGAAFRSRPGDPLFLPGTPLAGVVLVLNGAPGSPRPAEVRQVALETAGDGAGGPTYRVGLALDVERARPVRGSQGPEAPAVRRPGLFARAAEGDGLAGRLVRRLRAPLEALRATRVRSRARAGGPLVNVVRYRRRDGEPIVGLVNSTQPIGRAGARLRGPLVVIPPAYGKTKETYSALALMITETFRRHGRDVVVVRYDGTYAVGESHKAPEDWPDERQMMRFTLSAGAGDLLATLDYFHGRPWFRPTHTVVISFSLAALSTRRAILSDPSGRTTHWLSVVGAPDAQEVIFNATGGFDAIGGHQLGIRYGTVQVLNHLIDADHFSQDAVASGLATLQDARRDLGRIAIPVTWFVGRDDRWVRAERVYDVMSVAAPAPREVVELPVGHTMRSSAEALASFDTIIRHLWRQLHGETPVEVRADEAAIKRVAALERGRLPRRRIGDAREYWSRYLVGDDGRGIGFDLWATTPAYTDLMDLQRQLLDVCEGDVVADLGAGTGNFTAHLLDRLVRDGFRASPRRLVVADLVPAALELARAKAGRILEGVLAPSDFLEFRELNLETSRLRPIRRFLAGEFPSVEGLRGLVDGLPDATLDAWLAVYDERLHAWLRGAAPDGPLRSHVGRLLKGVDLEVAVEFNRAARWTLGRLAPEDLSADLGMAEARAVLADARSATVAHLRFDRLRFDGPGLDDALPFPDASLDKAVMSLVLSYLFDPVETLREVHRILRPGGRLVASTMRPDADLSRTAEELVDRIRTDPAVHQRFGVSVEELSAAVQRYINSAASLLDLEEGGVFRFFSKEEMRALLEQAGFDRVKVYESFGRPPQAFVAVGVKR
ncbi:MAG TPA: methyltransferase domain-containing protein [Thermodesulfobacteriota bacterium]